MRKDVFILNHQIADAYPIDPSSKILQAGEFAKALDDFLGSKFCGCVSVSLDSFSTESILVCADYVAYFFKLLLCDIYGRVFLKLSFSNGEKGLIINIFCDEELPLCDDELRLLIKTARNAGMEILPKSQEIQLTLRYQSTYEHKVYALSISKTRKLMLDRLNEIFYSGEPIKKE